ncbi:MAG: leucine-rich repeat protein [Candidatus Methanoplasma sp.]|nr:leucine-rich repeat protein [Candidatus Methanoplasma sp.]
MKERGRTRRCCPHCCWRCRSARWGSPASPRPEASEARATRLEVRAATRGGGGGGEDLSAVTFSLRFDSGGGTPVEAQAVFKGERAHEPSDPAKAGMEFAGWYRDSALTVPWSFGDNVAGDMTLYAKWVSESRETGPTFKVSFDTGIAPALPDATGIAPGSRMVAPPALAMDGYRMTGWYRDEALSERWDFSVDRVTSDSTLYAGWARLYTVRYHFPAAAVFEDSWRVVTESHVSGEARALLDPGARDPYSFGGWYLMVGGVNRTPGDDASDDNHVGYPDGGLWSLSGDLDLYAYWEGTASLSYGDLGNGLSVRPSDKTATDVAIPEYYRGRPVTEIGIVAFSGYATLESIAIPPSVTTIGFAAFANCYALKSIAIPPGVTTIQGSAFYGCAALESVTLPQGIDTVGNDAFSFCTSLKSIILPSGLRTIGERAFNGCDALKTVTLPQGLEEIKSSAFLYCSAISEIYIPSSVKSIWPQAFANCTGMKKIGFAAQQTATGGLEIENAAFLDCSGIEEAVVLPSGLKKIGGGAFTGCVNIPSVFIPNTASKVETAFPNALTMTSPMTIYVEADPIPSGWDANWNYDNAYQLGSARPQ